MKASQGAVACLFLRVGDNTCALATTDVIETMRPVRIAPVVGLPSFLLGVATIRGIATPVVDCKRLIGDVDATAPARFVTVRASEGRAVALAVDGVLGVRDLALASFRDLPPLLRGSGVELAIAAIRSHDHGLLVVLETARIVPDDIWATIAARAELLR